MKYIWYPLLFLLVIFLPTSLATVFDQQFITSILGYIFGYYLTYSFTQTMNQISKQPIYPKRIQSAYLIANAIVSLLLLGTLRFGVATLYAGQPLNLATTTIFIGMPWVATQMILLLFFVRYESLDK